MVKKVCGKLCNNFIIAKSSANMWRVFDWVCSLHSSFR